MPAPGSHLDLIGGFTPAMREADDACFSGSSLYVDTVEALQKSGDLPGPMSPVHWNRYAGRRLAAAKGRRYGRSGV